MTQNPPYHPKRLKNVDVGFDRSDAGGRIVKAETIERFRDVCHFSRERHGGPEFPIAANAEAFIRPANEFVGSPAKEDGASIGDDVCRSEITSAKLASVHAKVPLPNGAIDTPEEPIRIVIGIAFWGDPPGTAPRESDVRVRVQSLNQTLKQARVGIVV